MTRLHIRHKHFKPLPRRTFYRLTSTLLATHHRWSESRMVIFFLIKRTVWDRYLQVVIVKLDAINAASSFHSRTHIHVTGVAQGQRAGLITPRTYDRNVSPVYIHHIAMVHKGTGATSIGFAFRIVPNNPLQLILFFLAVSTVETQDIHPCLY